MKLIISIWLMVCWWCILPSSGHRKDSFHMKWENPFHHSSHSHHDFYDSHEDFSDEWTSSDSSSMESVYYPGEEVPQTRLRQKQLSSDRILFPEDGNPGSCMLNNNPQRTGLCKFFMDCEKAMKEWNEFRKVPERCGTTEFICCEDEQKQVNNGRAAVRQNGALRSAYGCVEQKQAQEEEEQTGETVYGIFGVNGEPALPNEFPYMAALGWTSRFVEGIIWACGGVLFWPNYILTAAHCLRLNGQAPTRVRLGDEPLSNTTEAQVYKIKRIVAHPDYTDSSAYNDIGIIELEGDTSSHKAACIWIENRFPTNNVTAIGYGHTKFGGAPSNELIKLDIFLNSNAECSTFYPADEDLPRGLLDTQICAGDPIRRRDTCQRDSGGPMVIRLPKNDTEDETMDSIVGLTSLGQACGGPTPSIYTNVAPYIDWIEQVVFSNT